VPESTETIARHGINGNLDRSRVFVTPLHRNRTHMSDRSLAIRRRSPDVITRITESRTLFAVARERTASA